MLERINEKCAVAGFVGVTPEISGSVEIYEALYAMQHRGAEASGIVSEPEYGNIRYHRRNGLVRDVYSQENIDFLSGSSAIGHNRYSTNGSKTEHYQPVIDKPLGYALAHNGNLPDTTKLAERFSKYNINTSDLNDSELMGIEIAQRIRRGSSLPEAVEGSFELFEGAFSSVAMHNGLVVAFRDSSGIRPLALGQSEQGYVVTSETCGLDIIGAEYIREVKPGEMITISRYGIDSKQIAEPNGKPKLDIFEFVYFARHDSYLYGKSVNEIRYNFGRKLAEEHALESTDSRGLLVVPVPDTSIPAAEGYSDTLGLDNRQVIIKNRYIGRTFMGGNQNIRKEQLRRKHNMIAEPIKGRDIVIIDDSIVRLNTMPRLVELAKYLGAKSVSVLIASPPVRFPDYYGIDTPEQSELAAANMTINQMRDKINCDYLGFLSLRGMVDATGFGYEDFNLSCFNGDYPIPIGKHSSSVKKPISMQYVN